MIRFRASFIATLFVIACTSSAVTAQDTPLDKFKAANAKWSEVDEKINALVTRYRSAPASERGALVEQYNALVEQSSQLVPELRSTATEAYKVDPKADPAIERQLVGLVANDVRQDDYEAALELSDMLVNGGCSVPALDSFIGVAAYCSDDFARAEMHLAKAKAANALIQEAQGVLQDLPTAISAWTAEQAVREKEAQAGDNPLVKLETTRGTLLVELYENEAPGAVGNFVSLIESGFYNGLTFHRVLPGFMAQGGCPTGTGTGDPGYKIACECYRDDHRKHFRGTLSMAHGGKDTGGSQFFLTFKRTSHLDGKHTVFGRVVEGLDILAKLQRRDPSRRGELPTPDKIVKAEVVRKRDHDYKPNKVGG